MRGHRRSEPGGPLEGVKRVIHVCILGFPCHRKTMRGSGLVAASSAQKVSLPRVLDAIVIDPLNAMAWMRRNTTSVQLKAQACAQERTLPATTSNCRRSFVPTHCFKV